MQNIKMAPNLEMGRDSTNLTPTIDLEPKFIFGSHKESDIFAITKIICITNYFAKFAGII